MIKNVLLFLFLVFIVGCKANPINDDKFENYKPWWTETNSVALRGEQK